MSNLQIVKSFPVGGSDVAQYSAVDTAGGLVVTTTATDTAIGIMASGASANASHGDVVLFGITRGRAHDADISKGDLLELAAAGRLDTHSTTSTKPVVGMALEDSDAQDHEIEIFLFPQSDAGPAA